MTKNPLLAACVHNRFLLWFGTYKPTDGDLYARRSNVDCTARNQHIFDQATALIRGVTVDQATQVRTDRAAARVTPGPADH
eukprot:11635916-Heterocapsa_arctica.AAC.1